MLKYEVRTHALLMRIMHVTRATEELATSWIERWCEPHRYYHTLDHLFQMEEDLGERWHDDEVFIATLFHDIVYDPRSRTNEADSIKVMMEELPDGFKSDKRRMVRICEAIMETKHVDPPVTPLGKILCEADMRIITHTTLEELIAYEVKMCKEFQVFPHELYRIERIKFLNSQLSKNPAIADLIKYVQFRKLKIGYYPGSFDPFTIGHQNILQKAERIFDKVIIGRGLNPSKAIWQYALPPSLDYHQKIYAGNFTDLSDNEVPMKLRHPHMAAVLLNNPEITLIRGLRNGADLEMEKIQHAFNQQMMGDVPLNSVYITCDREFEHISSTAFKQLAKVDIATAKTCCPDGFPRVWRELKPKSGD